MNVHGVLRSCRQHPEEQYQHCNERHAACQLLNNNNNNNNNNNKNENSHPLESHFGALQTIWTRHAKKKATQTGQSRTTTIQTQTQPYVSRKNHIYCLTQATMPKFITNCKRKYSIASLPPLSPTSYPATYCAFHNNCTKEPPLPPILTNNVQLFVVKDFLLHCYSCNWM